MAKQQAQSDQPTNQATQSNPDAQQTPVGDVQTVTPATTPEAPVSLVVDGLPKSVLTEGANILVEPNETLGTPSDEELEQLEKGKSVPDAEADPEGFAQYLKEKFAKKRDALVTDRLAQVPEQEEEPTGSLDV